MKKIPRFLSSSGLFLTIFFSCNAQFLTPDQLREQHDIGFAARTHYEMSGSRLTDMFRRVNPDYLFRGKNFIYLTRQMCFEKKVSFQRFFSILVDRSHRTRSCLFTHCCHWFDRLSVRMSSTNTRRIDG